MTEQLSKWHDEKCDKCGAVFETNCEPNLNRPCGECDGGVLRTLPAIATYRIKPLVWESQKSDDSGIAAAIYGEIQYIVWIDDCADRQPMWSLFHEHGAWAGGECDSVEHGKELCQQHWNQELLKWLEVVT